MLTFNTLGLKDKILQSITKVGFEIPTEIQSKAIPLFLQGADIVGKSQTGSGKTAAYLLPLIDKLINTNDLAVILVPTRELAIQVEEVARSFLTDPALKLRMATIIGGSSMLVQTNRLKQRPHLIFATPGRLFDHIERGSVKFERLTNLILDEADRMLDMGFYPQIKAIVKSMPQKRQTALFSATFSPEIRKIAQEFLTNPQEVSQTLINKQPNEAPKTIKQESIETEITTKKSVLVTELKKRNGSVIVFVKTKHKTDHLARYLYESGFKVDRLHGDRSLNQRIDAVNSFKSGRTKVLVATDVAARGLDILNIEHVINFDLPNNPEDYLHRIGRTGRAGASGQALSIISPDDRKNWREIVKFIGKK